MIARIAEKDTKKIARDVFQLPRLGMELAGNFEPEISNDATLAGFEDFQLYGVDNFGVLDGVFAQSADQVMSYDVT